MKYELMEENSFILELKKTINEEVHTLFNTKNSAEISFASKYPFLFKSVKDSNESADTNNSNNSNNSTDLNTENIPEILERSRKKLKKFSDKSPLKKISQEERLEDLDEISKLLKENYRKRKIIKEFMNYNYLNYAEAHIRRSELIILDEIFRVNDEISVTRYGIKKKDKENKRNNKIVFDEIFREKNEQIFSESVVIKKISSDKIVIERESGNEETLKLKNIRRNEYLFEKFVDEDDEDYAEEEDQNYAEEENKSEEITKTKKY